MSGGVDSSVAALILRERGYDVVGVYMRCYNVDGCAETDAEDARRVAECLGIPFYVWDFEEEYKQRVVNYMIEGYRKGLTPNPDVMCNKEIKFGLFLRRAREAGAEYVATGHYVRKLYFPKTALHISQAETSPSHPSSNLPQDKEQSCQSSNSFRQAEYSYGLGTAKDSSKDQSYFLWTLTQEQLRHCLFPIGDYLKTEVRELARKAGLPTAEKKDSQGICFLGKVTLADFLKQYIPEMRGDVITATGEKIGEHNGAHFYTFGQRRGIGTLKHEKGTNTHVPLYVVGKDIAANTVMVAAGKDNPALYRSEIRLTEVNFIRPLDFIIRANDGIKVLARVRYRQPLASAHLRLSTNSEFIADKRIGTARAHSKQIHYSLIFDRPQKFVAPGQSAVLYSESGELLGGGVISAPFSHIDSET